MSLQARKRGQLWFSKLVPHGRCRRQCRAAAGLESPAVQIADIVIIRMVSFASFDAAIGCRPTAVPPSWVYEERLELQDLV